MVLIGFESVLRTFDFQTGSGSECVLLSHGRFLLDRCFKPPSKNAFWAYEPPSCPSFSGPRPNKCSTWLWSDSMSATEHWSSEILSLGKRSLPRLCQCPSLWCKISIFPLGFGDLHRFYLGGSWRSNISVSMYVIHHTRWPLKAEIQQLRLSERSDSYPSHPFTKKVLWGPAAAIIDH